MSRKTAFRLASLVVAYVVTELLCFVLYCAVNGELFSLSAVDQRREAVVREPQNTGALRIAGVGVPWNFTLHPYFGFGDPSGLAFLAEESHPVQSDPDGAVVAITGGSVAYHFHRDVHAELGARLKAIPAFLDKNVHVILLAQGAWKQPQQLHALAYYLAMGGKLDMIINIDGHNEVVDTGYNQRRGVFPAYPWLWHHLSSNVIAPEKLAAIGEITVLKRRRRETAARFGVFRLSVTVAVVWDAVDKALRGQIDRKRAALDAIEKDEQTRLPLYRSGPKVTIRSRETLFTLSARIWRQASLQLHRLAEGNDIRYFHFLQPNQYVPDSKPLSEEERRRAFDPRRSGVKLGYPFLLEAARSLLENGVAFHSLTDIFQGVDETVYVDTCCHMNARGNHLMAARIASVVQAAYATD